MLTAFRRLLIFAALFLAVPASAVPVTYGLTIGTITVQANRDTDGFLIFDETLTLSTDTYLTWDAAGVPAFGFGGTLDDFLISVEPGQGPFATLAQYGPFDMITVETGNIFPGTLYGTNLTFPSGGGFLFEAGEIDIDATYSATGPLGATTGGPVAADITNLDPINGTIDFTGGLIQVVMDSVTMGTIDGSPFGEASNLIITANVNFFGDATITPTPEPSTGLLVGFGLLGIAVRRRLRR